MNETILVADDEPGLRDFFTFVLEPLGYKLVCAADGWEALQAFEQHRFDLVILDVHMPHLHGPAALRRIREISPGVPVIMTSSGSDLSRQFEDSEDQAALSDYLHKPIELDELLQAIERALGRGARHA